MGYHILVRRVSCFSVALLVLTRLQASHQTPSIFPHPFASHQTSEAHDPGGGHGPRGPAGREGAAAHRQDVLPLRAATPLQPGRVAQSRVRSEERHWLEESTRHFGVEDVEASTDSLTWASKWWWFDAGTEASQFACRFPGTDLENCFAGHPGDHSERLRQAGF